MKVYVLYAHKATATVASRLQPRKESTAFFYSAPSYCRFPRGLQPRRRTPNVSTLTAGRCNTMTGTPSIIELVVTAAVEDIVSMSS